MTRHSSFQKGHVSRPIRTRGGETIYKIRYRVRTADGRWKQCAETLRGLAGRKAARAILEERIREATPAKLLASQLTLRGFIDAYWRAYLDRKGAKPSTRANYESALRAHVIPALGHLRLTDIVPLHIENLIQEKLATGLSAKTVVNLLALLQCICSVALDNDLIDRSPIRKKHKPAVQKCEKPIWTAEQVRLIVGTVPSAYRALFATAALTGARLGELLALQWRHVDLSQRKLRIEQSLWQRQIVPPKTTGSVRTIHFGEGLAQVFVEHSRTASRKGPEDFVFLSPTGALPHPDVLRKDVLYPALDRLGIPRSSGTSGFHTFRHSAASFINSQTGNIKLAQKLLGHSTIDMTAGIYTHTNPEEERQAAVALERAIYGNLFPNLFPTGNSSSVAAVN